MYDEEICGKYVYIIYKRVSIYIDKEITGE